jgi:hypothetical protein
MLKLKTIIIAACTVALAGTAALAASSDIHRMTVRLADGSIATVEYTGDVAPKITVTPAGPGFAAFGPQFAFADFEEMDRQMAAAMAQMHQQMQVMNAMLHDPGFAANANGPISAAFGSMPSGASFCARSVSITTDENGKQHVEQHQAGNCGGASAHGSVPPHAPVQVHGGMSI